MAEAEETLRKVCNLDEINRGPEWQELALKFRDLTKVVIAMGRERREVASIVNNADIKALVNDHSNVLDPVIYTDGSVKIGQQSG